MFIVSWKGSQNKNSHILKISGLTQIFSKQISNMFKKSSASPRNVPKKQKAIIFSEFLASRELVYFT